MNRKLKKFEDFLVDDDKDLKVLNFGEFRKGSSKYGDFIQELMMFLRNFKKDNQDNLIFKTKDVTFDVNMLYELTKDENKRKLIKFDIEFLDNEKNKINKPNNDGYIQFLNLNKKKEERPWENFDLNEK